MRLLTFMTFCSALFGFLGLALGWVTSAPAWATMALYGFLATTVFLVGLCLWSTFVEGPEEIDLEREVLGRDETPAPSALRQWHAAG